MEQVKLPTGEIIIRYPFLGEFVIIKPAEPQAKTEEISEKDN